MAAMNDDVDMDAPQISTLVEDSSPPPRNVATNNRFRVKLVVNPRSNAGTSVGSGPEDDELVDDDEEEDQEDQLIDDDDDQQHRPPPSQKTVPPIILPPRPSTSAAASTPPAHAPENYLKRKASSSATTPKQPKRPRKSDRTKPAEEGKLKEKVKLQPGGPNLAPTMSMFEANPSELHHEDPGNARLIETGDSVPLPLPGTSEAASAPPATTGKGTGKKRASRKAPAAASTSAAAAPKAAPKKKAAPRTKKTIAIAAPVAAALAVDDGIVSEAFTGTAASSPVTVHHDGHSPEPDSLLLPHPLTEDLNVKLDGPVPIYPLPSKPFLVQAPPRIITTSNPLPLDRSGKKVRKWRTANREIKGIGGGRWFARSWAGEKESEFAAAQTLKAEGAGPVAIPKLVAVAIAGNGTGKGKGKKNSSLSSSRSASVAPSEAGFSGSISAPVQGMKRAPTKMRTVMNVDISSEAGESVAPSEA